MTTKVITLVGNQDEQISDAKTLTEKYAPLAQRIRAHANFAEYIPYTLLLMMLCEINGSSGVFLNTVGVALTLGRILHVELGMLQKNALGIGRTLGAVLSVTSLVSLGIANLYTGARMLFQRG